MDDILLGLIARFDHKAVNSSPPPPPWPQIKPWWWWWWWKWRRQRHAALYLSFLIGERNGPPPSIFPWGGGRRRQRPRGQGIFVAWLIDDSIVFRSTLHLRLVATRCRWRRYPLPSPLVWVYVEYEGKLSKNNNKEERNHWCRSLLMPKNDFQSQ